MPWGSVFMSKPCETLKDWTHWGVMGVINPRHSAGDCQSESISLLSCEPCSTVYFLPVSWCTYRRKVIELNLTQQAWHSLGKKCSSVSQREVNWDSLQFSSICAVDCAAAEKYKFQNSFHWEVLRSTLQYKLRLCCRQSSVCLKAGLSRARGP